MSLRAEFSSSVKRTALERSAGICECHLIPHVFPDACGRPIGPGNTFYEHIDPEAISKRNDIENCAVLCRTCW
ncbi:MAG: HNH endonuclease, partial [Rhizobiales bacterium]|nr:HNH endonuclease [Hyphomicrobiales bacterium]